MTATELQKIIRKAGTKARAEQNARYFKTGPGEYGEGDIFVGVTVPELRKITKGFSGLALSEIETLFQSKIHEDRLAGIYILIAQFEKGDAKIRKTIFDFCLAYTDRINNWDLVDNVAPCIVGPYLRETKQKVPEYLIVSKNLWEHRIAMVSTLAWIRKGESSEAIRIAKRLLSDPEDLMHKATGWMLREVGKYCGREVLEQFLEANAKKMPRTALRYSIEHFPESKRKHFMRLA